MRIITLLVVLCITTLGFSQNAPIDFETGGQGDSWTWTVFENDDNPALEVVANPDTSGINTSATVAKFTARAAGQPYAGVESMHGSDIGTFDLTAANAVVNIMVYKTKISDVGIKFATAIGGSQPEIKVANTLVNQWEMISIDFSDYIGLGETTGLDQIIVFPDFVARPADDIIYFDNITFGPQVVTSGVDLPITFEGGQAPTFGDFNGSATQIIANPDISVGNPSDFVAENTVPAGASFAGTNFPVDTAIDITTEKGFTMRVWSPFADTPVLLKLENATTGVNKEREVSTTTGGAWETITFDFSDEGALTFESVTIFMNFNMTGLNSQVYYWDNLEQIDLNMSATVELPITFEGGQAPAFGDFNGSVTQIIANPDATGSNTSVTVAENTVPAGASFAGTNFAVDTAIDITTEKGFTMRVWSPFANTPVLLKLENATTGVNEEREVPTTTGGAWETITFDFSDEGALTFESVTIFMNFNMTGLNSQVYYWDNLEQIDLNMSATVELPITFEGGQAPAFGDFNGSVTQIIANPDATGSNTSVTVAENTVPAGASFAGTNFPVDTAIDITTEKGFTMDVWSPFANTPVLLKLENATTGVNEEREVSTTIGGAWETLTFDFSDEDALTFESVTIFMNFNVTGLNSQVYYWDNLEQVNLVVLGDPVVLPITFEDGNVDYNPIGFEGADSVVEVNAVSGGINTSATVLRTTKTVDAQFYAGTAINLGTAIDFSNSELITMKSYSPKMGIPVKMRLENADNSSGIEFDVNTTMLNEWETLTFDFTGQTAGIDFVRVVVFYEFVQDLLGDGSTYYFDDVAVAAAPIGDPVVLPITFEDGNVDYNPIGFEGADSAVEANAVSGGINTSATVLRTTKTVDAQFYAGTAINLGTAIDFSNSELITMKSYSPKMGIPVKMRLENADNSSGIEFDVNTTMLNEWETLTFDFTGQTAGIDFVRVVVFYEFVQDLLGDGSTYYFDDVAVAAAPIGDPVVLPITFEDGNVDYNPIGFEGADSVVEANAVSGGINTSATVLRTTKTVDAQFYAGTAINLGTAIDFSESEKISIKSYSPKMDIPVKMRLENADNSSGIEFDVNTTTMNEWETLTFDFTGQTAGIDFVRVVVFYEFVVDLPGDGSTYYFDDVMVAEPLSVSENSLKALVAFPNPAINTLTIDANETISTVAVYSILGQRVMSIDVNATTNAIDVSSLANGTYVMNVTFIDGASETIKFMKK